MSPAGNNTPPASPGFGEGQEDDELLNDGDAIEVIFFDLDEVLGNDEDESEEEMEEGGASALDPPPEDNSELVFDKHQSKS